MLRIFGHELAKNKSIYIALTKIFGLGVKLSLKFLKNFEINPMIKVSKINMEVLEKLYSFLETKIIFENKLRKNIDSSIERLKYIKSYRGLRHISSLPLRGQRTRTNAKTMKKKRNLKLLNNSKTIWKKKK